MNAQSFFRSWLGLGLVLNLLVGGVQTLFGPGWLWLVLMPLAGWLSCAAPQWWHFNLRRHGPQAVRVRARVPSPSNRIIPGAAPGSETA